MKTRAVRLYGESDLRLEEFDMGELKDDEILMELITDSVCMSTYKESIQGAKHQRVNDDISEHPIIVGHEFAGIIREVGAKWKDKYQVGTKYTMQPAINIKGSMAAIGYSYEYCGGAATFIKVPPIVMEKDCLLPFDENSAFFEASLAEPMSCIIGAFHSMYHSERGVYEHKMGIVEGGKSALLASCGPMGLGAISYMLNCDRKPSLLVITDIDEVRLKRASELFTEEYAKERGVEIHFVNTAKVDDPVKTLRDLTGGTGFDDVSVYAPVRPVIEMADEIGAGIVVNNRVPAMIRLNRPEITMMTGTKLVSVNGGEVTVERRGTQEVLSGFTHIIYACGARPVRGLYEELKEAYPEAVLIGDAQQPAQALEAVRQAVETAVRIG